MFRKEKALWLFKAIDKVVFIFQNLSSCGIPFALSFFLE